MVVCLAADARNPVYTRKGATLLSQASPAATYDTRHIEGWTLHINTALWQIDRAATETALALLQKQLAAINHAVPRPALTMLHMVPLWFSPEYPGIQPRAEYHPGVDWLRENGRNPAMAKCVEFTNIRTFPQETDRMPWFALHELAHAYHDQVLGFDNPEIEAAYERARASKKYDRVERWLGSGKPTTIERAYAMTNAQEFFAESSEAYFGRNDFFPFTRSDLKKLDPETYTLLKHLWNRPNIR
jgi:hypothetical protein